MSRDQRVQAVGFAAVFALVCLFSLLSAIRWSALETRGVRVTATLTGAGWQSKGSGLIVTYRYSVNNAAPLVGRSDLPKTMRAMISVGARWPAVSDPRHPSRSALLASFPDDGGHPYRGWLRTATATLCLMTPFAVAASVVAGRHRAHLARSARPAAMRIRVAEPATTTRARRLPGAWSDHPGAPVARSALRPQPPRHRLSRRIGA